MKHIPPEWSLGPHCRRLCTDQHPRAGTGRGCPRPQRSPPQSSAGWSAPAAPSSGPPAASCPAPVLTTWPHSSWSQGVQNTFINIPAHNTPCTVGTVVLVADDLCPREIFQLAECPAPRVFVRWMFPLVSLVLASFQMFPHCVFPPG